MKREILFRGQRKNKEWMYGDLLEYNGKTQIIQHHFDGKWSIERNDVVAETIGQYTGLLDKNGVRIFEGDILTNYDTCNLLAGFDNGSFSEINISPSKPLFQRLKDYGQHEIIGNIYDTPEKLK